MKLTTEQEEQEAKKAAETDAAAMERLLQEQEAALPETEKPPPEPEKTVPEKAEKPPEPPPPAPEKAAAPPPEGVKAKNVPAAEQDEFEKKLSSPEYEPPVGATRAQKEILKAVKTHATEEHRRYREADTRAQALEREKQELQIKLAEKERDSEELGRYRPIVERLAIEHDPNFNANFNGRIAAIEHRIIKNLMTWGLEKPTADYIMQHGGPAYFSKDSVSTVPAAAEDENGEPVRMTHKQFWEQRVIKPLSDDNQDSVRLAFDDELRVKEARNATLRDALTNREAYFKNLEEQSQKNEQAFKAECLKQLEAQRKDLGEIAVPQEIPTTATPEERTRIEKHNAALKEASEKFDTFFLDRSPEALVRKALGGLLLDHVRMLLAEKDDKTAAVQAQLDELQKKWNASLKAANTSHRQSLQQTSKPVSGIEFDKDDGRRMDKLLEELPA